jgi:hypothetical protein
MSNDATTSKLACKNCLLYNLKLFVYKLQHHSCSSCCKELLVTNNNLTAHCLQEHMFFLFNIVYANWSYSL